MHLGGAFRTTTFSLFPITFLRPFYKKARRFLNPIQKTATLPWPVASGVFSFHPLAPGFCLLGRNDRGRSGGRNLHGPSDGSGHDGWYVSARALASCTLVVSVSGSKVVGLWDVQRICRDGGLRSHQCMWKGQWMEIFIASIGSFWKFALDTKRFLFQRCMGISSNCMMYEYNKYMGYMEYTASLASLSSTCTRFHCHLPWKVVCVEFSWDGGLFGVYPMIHTTWKMIQHKANFQW